MEPHQQQQNQHQPNGACGDGGKGNCHCRPTCPRWTPTSDQIRILKELYYNNGVRSPTAEQIQKISARLRQYGKIEGKNVFYWFQNYKARERLKKKIEGNTITDDNNNLPMHHQRPATVSNNWKSEGFGNKSRSHTITSAGASAPPPSYTVYTVGQTGDHGYGPVVMEKSFRDCSISSTDSIVVGGSGSQNLSWVGIDTHSSSSYILFGQKNHVDHHHQGEEEEDEEDEEEENGGPGIETLPLFPMHGEDNNCNHYSGWYGSNDVSFTYSSPPASLELSLSSSYTGRFSGSL